MTTGPHYQGQRLDGPTEEFHQAMDRLRWDTAPTTLDHPQPANPPTPRRRRRDPGDGQTTLVEEASCTSTCT
jgi:hypothetical protein